MTDDGIAFVRADVVRLCSELDGLAPATRLARLAALRDALSEEMTAQLRAAASSARDEGWGLRRIASMIGVSHEQVRRLLTSGPPSE